MNMNSANAQRKPKESEILAGLAKLPTSGIVGKLTEREKEELKRTQKAESQPVKSSFMVGVLTD